MVKPFQFSLAKKYIRKTDDEFSRTVDQLIGDPEYFENKQDYLAKKALFLKDEGISVTQMINKALFNGGEDTDVRKELTPFRIILLRYYIQRGIISFDSEKNVFFMKNLDDCKSDYYLSKRYFIDDSPFHLKEITLRLRAANKAIARVFEQKNKLQAKEKAAPQSIDQIMDSLDSDKKKKPKKSSTQKRKERKAGTTIQAAGRGYLGRQHTKNLRNQRERAYFNYVYAQAHDGNPTPLNEYSKIGGKVPLDFKRGFNDVAMNPRKWGKVISRAQTAVKERSV